MTKEEVDRKWLDKPSVQSAFSQAYDVLSKAIEVGLGSDEKVSVFGDHGEYWFSAEILAVVNPNIIVYGQNVISPHKFGARKFNEATGHLEDSHDDAVFDKLLGLAQKIDGEMAETGWKLSAPVVYPLVKLGSKEPLKEALASIDAIMQDAGMNDSDTVGKYIKVKLGYYLKPYGIDGSISDELGKRLTGDDDRTVKINSLRKYAADEEQYIRIVALDRNKKKIFKTITQPIENVITKFASELLEGSKSMLVVDHSGAAAKVRTELQAAIEKIKSSPDALAALGDQLNKLQAADRITSTIEGIVFRRNGKSYKFTGQFAPINQLIGALKYGGRGYDDEEGFVLRRKPNADSTVTIFPGAFKPYHRGHDRVVRLASMQSDKVLLLVSESDREKSGEVPILGATMREIWNRYILRTLPANVMVEFTDNPVTMAYQKLNAYDRSGQNVQVNLLAGDEDIARFRPDSVSLDAPRLAEQKLIDIVSVPRFGNVSGTDMRSFIAIGDTQKFTANLPDDLKNVGREIFEMIRTSGLRRVKELQANKQAMVKPRGIKPITEIFNSNTTMAITNRKPTTPSNVKMNMKDLAKLIKQSLKESLAEVSTVKEDVGAAMADDAAAADDAEAADQEMVMEAIAAAYKAGLKKGREQNQRRSLREAADAVTADAEDKLKKLLHRARMGDEMFDVFQFKRIVAPLLPKGTPALHALNRAAEGVLQKHQEDPKRFPRVLDLSEYGTDEFVKLVIKVRDEYLHAEAQAERDKMYQNRQMTMKK
jgi:nicotinamide mononucleotide adenylyltransferase